MYVYLYDKATKDPHYESMLAAIETRLIEFGMNGKVERLTVYKDLDRVIEQHVKKGARTVVAVGDDATLRGAMQACWNHDVTIGFIPLKKTVWADRLRLPVGVEAVDVLSKRLTRSLSVGLTKNFPILEECDFTATADAWVRCDDEFTITFTQDSLCRIINESTQDIDNEEHARMFRIVVTPLKNSRFKKKKHTESTFFTRSCMVSTSTNAIPLSIDGVHEIQSPAELTLYRKHLDIVVGKSAV
ncbi:MAG: hypothetical protein KIH62_003355 [Candidatus Kerfeldbacteria bacterium]|nr:hypothetical protein [Candidatus Kerfeldbacteria bacterium]